MQIYDLNIGSGFIVPIAEMGASQAILQISHL
jgi:hypothetical protein